MTVRAENKNPNGKLKILPSKSVAHRLLICAALSSEKTEIVCPADSLDIRATVRCLNSLGSEISEKDGIYTVHPMRFAKSAELMCGESGSTLRFLIPLAATLWCVVTFTGEGRLPSRPIAPLLECLSENGAKFSHGDGFITKCHGGLHGGVFRIAGDVSSQFISGLIFALPLLAEDSTIEILGKCESKAYIDMTLSAVKKFGISAHFEGNKIHIKGNQKYITPKTLTVEGDWSNAAFFLCLGAFSDEGITVGGLNSDTLQGDRAAVKLLSRFGAFVRHGEDFVTVRRGSLCGIEIDAAEIPDLVPIISVVASVAKGKTTIYNAERLRLKESDRIATTAEMINALGGEARITATGLEIIGKERLSGGRVNAHNDHRIAMSAAIASAVCKNEVIIDGAEAVNKSYGDFFERYKELGAEVKTL